MVTSTSVSSNSLPRPSVGIFGLAILLSAFLLFLVQPLIAKFILPWFGGAPGVWTTCMMFFQAVLLAGYCYAHLITRYCSLRLQLRIHFWLIVCAIIFLPITPSDSLKPEATGHPFFQIVWLLTQTLGLPYLLLCTTGPLMQGWFARTHRTHSPYRLYALSNAGSLSALVSFPFVIEPYTTRIHQSLFWSCGLLIFAMLSLWIMWSMRTVPSTPVVASSNSNRKKYPIYIRILWIALPACATALLMSTTNKMCQDLAVVPFLWILPLAIYLITFIVTFEGSYWYSRTLITPVVILSWLGTIWLLNTGLSVPILWQITLYSFVLLCGCMVCHGELYRLRPSPAHLTGYYLSMAFGGALGGLFVAGVAPFIFQDYWEFHWSLLSSGLLFILVCLSERVPWCFTRLNLTGMLSILWCVLVATILRYRDLPLNVALILGSGGPLAGYFIHLLNRTLPSFRRHTKQTLLIGAASVIVTGTGYLLLLNAKHASLLLYAHLMFMGVLVFSWYFAWMSHSRWLQLQLPWWSLTAGLVVTMVVLSASLTTNMYRSTVDQWYAALGPYIKWTGMRLPEPLYGNTIVKRRNFYGVLKVVEYDKESSTLHRRTLINGNITHGLQKMQRSATTLPTSYYATNSGVGLALQLSRKPNKRVGIVGLGAGSLAAYGQSGDYYQFYEINPDVIRLSREEWFTYVTAARARNVNVSLILGDARLVMEREQLPDNKRYDVLVLDAFSSDSIPVHLLTREAFVTYQRLLAPKGVLAVHISNRYLDLNPVMMNLAEDRQFQYTIIANGDDDDRDWIYSSRWVLLTNNLDLLKHPQVLAVTVFPPEYSTPIPLWTDDYASLFRILIR